MKYTLIKETKQGHETYLTIKNIAGNHIAMFTGNIDNAVLFNSTEEAKEFYETYSWSELPKFNLKSI